MPLLIIFAFAVLQNVNGGEAGYTLLQVQAVSRHGVRERTASNSLPNLKCPSFAKFQMVTPLGHEQNYRSGKGLRETYNTELFPENAYIPANHIFQSTDEPKTILSTQSVFQGVFYDTYDPLDLTIFPIAPSYISLPIDNVLMASTTCAAKIKELRDSTDLPNTNEWKQKQAEYKEDFGKIYDEAGFSSAIPGTPPNRNALTLDNIPRAAEQVILAYEHGFTHPDHKCVYSKTPTDLNKVAIDAATFRNKMQNRPYNTSETDGEIAKLQASPYFNNVIREFLTKTGKSNPAQLKERSFIYVSGDNANILGPIQLVGRESFGRAPFGSVFFFELYVKDTVALPYKEEDLLVKVGWRNFEIENYNISTTYDSGAVGDYPLVKAKGLAAYTDVEWYTADLCGEGKTFCTIAELRKRIYTDAEWTSKCFLKCEAPIVCDDTNKSKGDGGLDKTSTALLIVMIILAVLLVGAIIAAVIFFVRAKVATAKADAAAASPPAKSSTHTKSGNADTEQEAGAV